jgi:hypothetical protein
MGDGRTDLLKVGVLGQWDFFDLVVHDYLVQSCMDEADVGLPGSRLLGNGFGESGYRVLVLLENPGYLLTLCR